MMNCAATVLFVLLLLKTVNQIISDSKTRARNRLHEVEFDIDSGLINQFDFIIDQQLKAQYVQCCDSGRKHSSLAGHCNGGQQFQLRLLTRELLGTGERNCERLWSLCCLEQQAENHCVAGINEARLSSRSICSKDNYLTNQCCVACQSGLKSSLMSDRQICYISWVTGDVISPHSTTQKKSSVFSHIEMSFRKCCLENSFDAEEQLTDHSQSQQNKKWMRMTNRNSCPVGFQYDTVARKCVDIDECSLDYSKCGQRDNGDERLVCVNTIGSFRCSKCHLGFRWNESKYLCVDINECEDLDKYPCFNDQTCMNTVGSFVCMCQIGFVMDPVSKRCKDVNECQLGTHNCHETLRCDNTIGSFHCVRVQDCGTGYTINADNDVCEDVDECELGLDNCLPDYQCRNTEGSFRCDRINCPPGQTLVNGICQYKTCGPGFVFSAATGKCDKVNACDQSPCRFNEQCVERDHGKFSCITRCEPGFDYDHQVKQCIDVDECALGTAECASNQKCINLKGHYDCLCQMGYRMGHDRQCADVDECAEELSDCLYPHRCVNTIGSYHCDQCESGYNMSPYGNCVDLDECRQGSHQCQHKCTNTPGGYWCSCRTGFQLASDGKTCQDVDECELMKQKSSLVLNDTCSGVCQNTIGSYVCSCPIGFQSRNNHCIDVNECLEGLHNCKSNETCINQLGGYQCVSIDCPPEYFKISSFNSVQCIMKKSNEDGNRFRRMSHLYYSLYNNQTIGSNGFVIYATRFDSNSSYKAYFDLRLVDATNRQTEIDDFRLIVNNSNEAKISIINQLTGPQSVQLKFYAQGIRNSQFNIIDIHFYIHVSQYGKM